MSISDDAVNKPAASAAPSPSAPVPSVPSGSALRANPSMPSYVLYGLILCAGIAAAWLCFKFLLKSTPARVKIAMPARPVKKITTPSVPAVGPAPAVVPLVSAQPPAVSGRELTQETQPDQPVEPPSLVLSGVFTSQQGDFAILNNQVIKVGGSIEGAKLLKVTSDGVSLEFSGREFKLSTRKR